MNSPRFGKANFVAPTAYVCGDVVFGANCSVWPGVVIRGDIAPIRIGSRVNIQDAAIVHTRHGVALEIEDEVGIGHRAVVHCRRVGAGSLIGIGAVVLDDCVVGSGCLVAAGAVVTPRTTVPDGMLVVGVPARVVRPLNDEERAYLRHVTENYVRLSQQHHSGAFPPAFPPTHG